MASRFWGASESESEDSDFSSDVEEGTTVAAGRRVYAFASDSSDEEDETRVVRSAKDKRLDELLIVARRLNTLIRVGSSEVGNWNSIYTEFEAINKAYVKASKAIGSTPIIYVAIMSALEDFLLHSVKDKETIKKMSATNAKSLNIMKQRLKKNNVPFAAAIEKFRANPVPITDLLGAGDADDDEDSDDDSDDGAVSLVKIKAAKPAAKPSAKPSKSVPVDSDDDDEDASSKDDDEDEDEEDSDFWASSSDDSSSEEEDLQGVTGRARWLKSTVIASAGKTKDTDEDRRKKAAERLKRREEADARAIEEKQKRAAAGKDRSADMSPEEISARLREIMKGRGKKNVDRTAMIAELMSLADIASKKSSLLQVEVLLNLIATQFENPSLLIHLPLPMWRSSLKNCNYVMDIIDLNPNFVVELSSDIEVELGYCESSEKSSIIRINANLQAFLDRLEAELTSSLQAIDPHSTEYVDRLLDTPAMLNLAGRVQKYHERINNTLRAASGALTRIELIYYQTADQAIAAENRSRARWATALAESEARAKATEEAAMAAAIAAIAAAKAKAAAKAANDEKEEQNEEEEPPVVEPPPVELPVMMLPGPSIDVELLMEELSSFVYQYGDDREKTRAMLCHIYHHALFDRFHVARDMMLMSHMQETIGNADLKTQILFNRTTVQVGLCAFRAGLINDASSALTEFYGLNRMKELLAQGVSNQRFGDRNIELERLERSRMVPFHQHISLDVIECSYLVSAMLLEIPAMAVSQSEQRRKAGSKSFRRHLEHYDRQIFTGPPENTREYIMAAATSLRRGDWMNCSAMIMKLPTWKHIPNASKVQEMVKRKIQEEALRTYCFTYAAVYDSMSLDNLCEMFALTESDVYSIISKAILNEELHASWDQPSRSIVMHKVEASSLQQLALTFADKAAQLVENNERILDSRTGVYGYKYDQNQVSGKDTQDGRWQSGRGGRGGRGGLGRVAYNNNSNRTESNRGRTNNRRGGNSGVRGGRGRGTY